MKLGWLVLAGLLCVGCDDAPKKAAAPQPAPPVNNSGAYWVTCQGTIWTIVQAYNDDEHVSHMVIATDDGAVISINLVDKIPAGAVGVHGIFCYESADKNRGLWKNFAVKHVLGYK